MYKRSKPSDAEAQKLSTAHLTHTHQHHRLPLSLSSSPLLPSPSSTSAVPSPAPPSLCSLHQLEGFVKANPTARPINSECTVYEVPISTIYGRLSLLVQFPPSFPSTAPLVQVTSLVQHPWVDKEMYITHHPKLQHWTPNTSAGQVINDIVQEWTKAPPSPAVLGGGQGGEAKGKERKNEEDDHWVVVGRQPGHSPMGAAAPSPALTSQSSLPPSFASSASPPQSASASKPSAASSSASASSPSSSSSATFSLSLPIPTSFPFLSSLSLAELQHLDANPVLLTDHLLTLPSSIQLQHIRQDMHSTLMQQTAQTLAMQAPYQTALNSVRRLRAEVDEERRALDEAMRRQEAVVGRWSVGGLMKELERSIDEAERKSEKTRERYMGGREEEEKVEGKGLAGGRAAEDEEEKDVVKRGDAHARFIDAYVKQRALVHERSAKRERLIEQLTQRGQGVSGHPHG